MIRLVAPPKQHFEHIVREFYDDVYRFACSLTKREADAADLTQQAFLRYARKGHHVKDQGKIKSWLFSVLRNEFTDHQRRKTRYPHVAISPAHEEAEAPDSSTNADWEVARSALHTLPPNFRETLSLYYLEGYTYQEIATVLKIPVGTVMSRLSRGKARLRALLEDPVPAKPPHD